MNCRDFLARHSDYVDGLLDATGAALLHAHAEACASCARYDRVVRRGAAIARDLLPTLTVSEDFVPRLRHRLHHERDGMSLRRPGGISMLAAAITMVVITGAAWSLALSAQRTPVVDGQVVFAAVPATLARVQSTEPIVLPVPAAPREDVSAAAPEAPAATGGKGGVARVPPTGSWPIYSRGVAAVVFHQPSLAVAPVQLRGGGRAVATPLIVRH